ncbi:sodium:calcium antiporter [Patescibacteria group bacterium]|nr:sodium:calcium antiporter [Patescibacteria group bacterium]
MIFSPITFHLLLLLFSAILMAWAANRLVQGITNVARYLKWLEFVIAFFVMALAASIPNLFVGISSALHGIPELSFGDVVGNSVIDLTLVAGLAVLLGANLISESKLVQTSSFFTIIIAILPLLLILDGQLGRGDGAALIFIFILYSIWLFSHRKDFVKTLDRSPEEPIERFQTFLWSIVQIILGIVLILIAAEGIVRAATFFAAEFHIPIAMIGILVLGTGNALPEIYFAIASAKKGKTLLILGTLMGSVVVLATLVLGIVALIHPIEIEDFSPFQTARFFLIISALFFLIFSRTDRRISKREALFLIFLYILFVAAEIIF